MCARPTRHRHTLALALAGLCALSAPGCAGTHLEPDAPALLRAGRLADACQRAFFGGAQAREAVDGEVRRRIGLRLHLRVIAGPDDPEVASRTLPPLRFGRLAALTVTSAPSGDASSVFAEVDAPSFEARDGEARERATSWQVAREMSAPLAHVMVTGSELPGSGQTPRVLLDGVALLLSAGMVDPHLRDRPLPPPPPGPLPAPVQALLSHFTEPLRCAMAAGTRCARLLPLLPDAGRREPTHLLFEARWSLASQGTTCEQRRVFALPLPPGPDIAARVQGLFARGPVDLTTAPTVDR